MELFFMMTAMLALLGPIAVGRVRCIRIAPRMLQLAAKIIASVSRVNRASFDAGVLPGQICWATLHVNATASLRRLQCDLRWNAGVRSSVKASSAWMASPRSFSRDLSAV
jgi:hypothetical protein